DKDFYEKIGKKGGKANSDGDNN
ncbi:KGG domain-containing protein, partial [Periweissella beninensis]